MNNFWGDLPDVQNIKTPVTLLREQAGILTELTSGVLVAEVSMRDMSEYSWAFGHDLNIRVPAMGDYRITVLSVFQPLKMYPLDAFNRISENSASHIQSYEQFEAWLKKSLSEPEVRNVIASLLAQLKSA
jgi:hypothetical protein